MEKTKMSKQKRKRIIKENISAWVFLSPYMAVFTIFFIVPFFYGIIISFFDWNMFQPQLTKFVGFENYINVLFNSDSIFYAYFWSGLKNTLLFVLVSFPLLIGIPLILAKLIDLEPVGYKVFRTILFLPTVLSISAVILIWRWQFYTNGGFLNSLMTAIGLDEIAFLQTQPWAWISIIVVTIWWTMGTNMVILGAGMKNIDQTLYEAAEMDGASSIQSFMRITVPMLAPQLLIVGIMTLLASFNIYGQPDLLTQGGPNRSTTVIMMYIRQFAAGSNSQPGIATTMSLLLGMIMIVISVGQAIILRKRD
ncbi:sugar ABC transporter permease [Mycoplasmatota bacterium]|nr:sugar ABC transporter permease [Mycoplasmatota bacterium]